MLKMVKSVRPARIQKELVSSLSTPKPIANDSLRRQLAVRNWLLTLDFPVVNHLDAEQDEQAADQPVDLSCKKKREVEKDLKRLSDEKNERVLKRLIKPGKSLSKRASVISFVGGRKSSETTKSVCGSSEEFEGGGVDGNTAQNRFVEKRKMNKSLPSTARNIRQGLSGVVYPVSGLGGLNRKSISSKGLMRSGERPETPTMQIVMCDGNTPSDVLVDYHFARALGLETYGRILEDNTNIKASSGGEAKTRKRRNSDSTTPDSKRMKLHPPHPLGGGNQSKQRATKFPSDHFENSLLYRYLQNNHLTYNPLRAPATQVRYSPITSPITPPPPKSPLPEKNGSAHK